MNNGEEFKYFLNIEYLFNRIFKFFENLSITKPNLIYWVENFDESFKPVSLIISLVLFSLIALVIYKMINLRQKMGMNYADLFFSEEISPARSARWKAIKAKLDLDNVEEWKGAVLEADTLVEELFIRMGYGGETLEDKLKMMDPSVFLSLQDLWEAHRVKMKIVEEKESYYPEKEEIKTALDKYEKGLKELRYL